MRRLRKSLSPGHSRITSERERRRRWLWLPLLVAISCGAGDSKTELRAATVTDRAPIFLISLEDGGVEGRRLGCGDSAVPVEVTLARRGPALRGSLEALLALHETWDSRTGFYNALHASRLEIDRIERNGDEARIHLKGYLEIGDKCDSPRVLAQLTETALQFSDVQRAIFFLEGKPLAGLLAGR
jgi:hypothetical protein